MKRLLGILFILNILYASNLYADTVTVDSLVSADDVTLEWLNGFKNTVIDALNSFDGENIQADSITIAAFDDNSNIVTRWDESFNNYVYTGLLPLTSASLISITTTGTAYVEGTRVNKDATSHTYTASKDTYVDLSNTGTFTYQEVTNGAAEPLTTTNSIRLAKVVTSGTAVTSVTDSRVLGIQLSTNEDFNIKGFELVTNDPNTITIDSGVCYVGATRIEKTAVNNLNVGTASDYINGASERGTSKWVYIYIDDSGSIKLDDSAPDYHDTDGNTTGIKYYFKNGTDYWRLILPMRLNATGSGNIIYIHQSDKKINYDNPITNTPVDSSQSDTLYNTIDCSSYVPAVSRMASFQIDDDENDRTFYLKFVGSGGVGYVTDTSVGGYCYFSDIPLNTSQDVDFKVSVGTTSILAVKDYTLDTR